MYVLLLQLKKKEKKIKTIHIYLDDLILSALAFFHNDSKLLVEGFSVDGMECRDPTRTDFSNIHTSRIIIMNYQAIILLSDASRVTLAPLSAFEVRHNKQM